MFPTRFTQFQGTSVYRTSTLILKSPDTNTRALAVQWGGGGQKLANGLFPRQTLGNDVGFYCRFWASCVFSCLASAPFQIPSCTHVHLWFWSLVYLHIYYLLLCNQNQARMFQVFTVWHERQTCSCVKELSMYVYTNKMQSCIPRAGQLGICVYQNLSLPGVLTPLTFFGA